MKTRSPMREGAMNPRVATLHNLAMASAMASGPFVIPRVRHAYFANDDAPSSSSSLWMLAWIAFSVLIVKASCGYATTIPRLILAWTSGAATCLFVMLSAGAPVFRVWDENLILSAFLSVLLVTPMTFIAELSKDLNNRHEVGVFGAWLRALGPCGLPAPHNPMAISAALQIYPVIVGVGAGLWILPMDWAKGWQVWPMSVMVTSAAGGALGQILSAGYLMSFPSSQASDGEHRAKND